MNTTPISSFPLFQFSTSAHKKSPQNSWLNTTIISSFLRFLWVRDLGKVQLGRSDLITCWRWNGRSRSSYGRSQPLPFFGISSVLHVTSPPGLVGLFHSMVKVKWDLKVRAVRLPGNSDSKGKCPKRIRWNLDIICDLISEVTQHHIHHRIRTTVSHGKGLQTLSLNVRNVKDTW